MIRTNEIKNNLLLKLKDILFFNSSLADYKRLFLVLLIIFMGLFFVRYLIGSYYFDYINNEFERSKKTKEFTESYPQTQKNLQLLNAHLKKRWKKYQDFIISKDRVVKFEIDVTSNLGNFNLHLENISSQNVKKITLGNQEINIFEYKISIFGDYLNYLKLLNYLKKYRFFFKKIELVNKENGMILLNHVFQFLVLDEH